MSIHMLGFASLLVASACLVPRAEALPKCYQCWLLYKTCIAAGNSEPVCEAKEASCASALKALLLLET